MRPVGNRIKQVLEVLDRQPGLIYSDIARQIGIEPTNAYKYCSRAIGMGLIEADNTHRPAKYQAVDNWRYVLADLDAQIKVRTVRAIKQSKDRTPAAMPKRFVNSVWALA